MFDLLNELLKIVPTLCESDDARFIDENCDWSCAKHWAQWWTRYDHLKMLSKSFSVMEDSIWERCPSSTKLMLLNEGIEIVKVIHHNA